MVSLETKLANVMGGKNARACDNCIRKRARWYCPADDAFLCQLCDGSVHSANPLARRHERVRLKAASLKPSNLSIEIPPPSWLKGFTKKARTPRSKATKSKGSERTSLHHLVPCYEMETSHEDESDEHLLYRVPIFDPELCTATTPSSNFQAQFSNPWSNQIHGSLPSEMELAEFESLLGKGLDDEPFDIGGLGFSDHCKVEKVERENEVLTVVDHGEIDVVMVSRDEIPFELSFDYEDSANCTAEEEAASRRNDEGMISGNGMENGDVKILLRLDYDGVISAWNDQKSPWTAGERPELDSLVDCMGGCGTAHFPYGGDQVGMFGNPAIVDGGREARVSRYREKRRTRLFAKKIRYEVRKLNAEKRPRMKGRFVKRSNLPATGVPFSIHTK